MVSNKNNCVNVHLWFFPGQKNLYLPNREEGGGGVTGPVDYQGFQTLLFVIFCHKYIRFLLLKVIFFQN